jgi:acyl carrier protein
MKKSEFISRLLDMLELDASEYDDNTPLKIDSLGLLTIIAVVDECCDMSIKVVDLKNVNTITDIINIVGPDKFEA